MGSLHPVLQLIAVESDVEPYRTRIFSDAATVVGLLVLVIIGWLLTVLRRRLQKRRDHPADDPDQAR